MYLPRCLPRSGGKADCYMNPDAELVAETRQWFVKAERDLRMADLGRGASPDLNDQAVFHAQQAAEKAIKGFLTWHRRPFRKTHNLVELGEACAALQPELEPLLRRAGFLTEFAWKFRYPGEFLAPSAEETTEVLALAREVFDRLSGAVPREATSVPDLFS